MNSRQQALSLSLNALVIVVVQIVDNLLFEVLHRMEFLQVEQLAFEQVKEIFCYSIIQAIAFAAHALPDAFLAKHLRVLFVLVLPALVGMQDQLTSIRDLFKNLFHHSRYHTQNRPFRDGIADQIPVVQIKGRRKIEFLTKQADRRYICDPLLVRLFGMEVPVQQIWLNFANFAFVRNDTSSS